MKQPVVDYRDLRFSRLREPRFAHLNLLWGWVVYFLMYFLTERFIPAENCFVVHCALDDIIPFCEVFLIPYVFWYFLIVGSLLYFALYNVDSFKKLQTFLIITQVVAMVIYILFPNRQDLRPDTFARDNLLTQGVALLYRLDTSTNVCPSLHVAYSIGIASTWVKEQGISRWWKGLIVAVAVLICLSTTFIKQHSVVDALVALPVCLLAEGLVFGKSYWRARLRKT